MNFFEFHCGDYAEATGHLTFIEDAAYMRLLRKCYASERPIPADIAAAQRLVGARTDDERAAVETVLREFFELRDDGWHQARVDSEIARFKESEPERQVKKANEQNRVRRHRQERSELFRRLTDADQHAPWNIGISELRDMVAALPAAVVPATSTETPGLPVSAKGETPPATASATLATATQYPLPSTQVVIPSEAKASAAVAAPASAMSAKERAWAVGVALLGEKGRPFLGKLASTYGDELLAAVIADTAHHKPVDPKAWITTTCAARAAAKKRGNDGGASPGVLLGQDSSPSWLEGTGFENVFDAENAGCRKGNAHQFREGRKVAAA